MVVTSSTGNVEWYSDFNLTDLVGTGDTLDLGVQTTGDLYYVIGVNGMCSSASAVINFTVEPLPITTPISGSTNPTAWTTEFYSVQQNTGATYEWVVEGGTIAGIQGNNSMSIAWGGDGAGLLGVIETSDAGCTGDTMFLTTIIGPNSVNEVALSPIQVYPNPATQWLTVALPESEAGGVNWQLYDMAGRVIAGAQNEKSQQFLLDVVNFSPGVYLLSITGSRTWQQRIIVGPPH